MIYPRFGPTSQWDTAAAQCIVEQAGGKVVDLARQPLRYGLDRDGLNGEFVVSVVTSQYPDSCRYPSLTQAIGLLASSVMILLLLTLVRVMLFSSI